MTPSPMIERPESPCIDVCALDASAGLCTGCGRTLAEIGEWSRATAEAVGEACLWTADPALIAILAKKDGGPADDDKQD